jgi:hypothetical protein
LLTWEEKLLDWGIPPSLAGRMANDLEGRYNPLSFSNVYQLGDIAGPFDWQDDLKAILEKLKEFIPGGIMIGVGAAIGSFMPEKLKMVAIVPAGIGIYMIYTKAKELGWI